MKVIILTKLMLSDALASPNNDLVSCNPDNSRLVSDELDEQPQLTCLSLVRRQKGKTVSMKLLLRDHASE